MNRSRIRNLPWRTRRLVVVIASSAAAVSMAGALVATGAGAAAPSSVASAAHERGQRGDRRRLEPQRLELAVPEAEVRGDGPEEGVLLRQAQGHLSLLDRGERSPEPEDPGGAAKELARRPHLDSPPDRAREGARHPLGRIGEARPSRAARHLRVQGSHPPRRQGEAGPHQGRRPLIRALPLQVPAQGSSHLRRRVRRAPVGPCPPGPGHPRQVRQAGSSRRAAGGFSTAATRRAAPATTSWWTARAPAMTTCTCICGLTAFRSAARGSAPASPSARSVRRAMPPGCHLHFEMWTKPGWYEGGHAMPSVTRHLKAWDGWS